MQCCLFSCELAKYRPDRQAESGQVALCQNISRHDFSGCINILERLAILIENPRLVVYGDAHVRKGDTWSKRKPVEWWAVDRHCPVTLAGINATRADAVQDVHPKIGVPRRPAIIFFHRLQEGLGIELQHPC